MFVVTFLRKVQTKHYVDPKHCLKKIYVMSCEFIKLTMS